MTQPLCGLNIISVVQAGACAVALSVVHRHVGAPQQDAPVVGVFGVQGDADTHSDLDRFAFDIERLTEPLVYARGQRPGLGRFAKDKDRKFVAAQPSDGVVVANQPAQPVGHLTKKHVTGVVAP